MARGEIENRERFRQIVNFKELTFGPNNNITPTDIDGFIDFDNKLFIVIELKLSGTEMKRGQELAIERLIDNLECSGKHAVALIAEHEVADTREDIDVYKCRIVKARVHKEWHSFPECDIKSAIEFYLKKYRIYDLH